MSNTITNINSSNILDDVAIDFRELLRQEKRRAKEKRKKDNEQHLQTPSCVISETGSVDRTADSNASPTFASSASTSSCLVDDVDWPMDWLLPSTTTSEMNNDEASSTTPDALLFVPDFDSSSTDTASRLSTTTTFSPMRQLHRVQYKRHFLNARQRTWLVDWLKDLPETTTATKTAAARHPPLGTWNTLKFAKRRVLMFDASASSSSSTTVSSLPLPLARIAQLLVSLKIFDESQPPNHVLINDYIESHQGILPHTDGPLYAPKTATISIGYGIQNDGDDDDENHCADNTGVLLNFSKRLEAHEIGMVDNPVELQVLLHGGGSLVVFEGIAYTDYCHSIQDVHLEYASNVCINASEGTRVSRANHRISLTFRHKL